MLTSSYSASPPVAGPPVTRLPTILPLLAALCAQAAEPSAPIAPPEIADPHDAIQQLRGEREKAETCLRRLHELGDAYAIAQGELAYEVAKLHMDAARSGLLAALDLDRDLFMDLAHLYPRFAERTTLYASDGDLALQLSGDIHRAPRAGYFTPYTVVPGIDTIAVPDFNIDLLGHGYFAQSTALLGDIHRLMLHDDAPDRRLRLSPRRQGELTFWEMAR